jgi:hypothetical protein
VKQFHMLKFLVTYRIFAHHVSDLSPWLKCMTRYFITTLSYQFSLSYPV